MTIPNIVSEILRNKLFQNSKCLNTYLNIKHTKIADKKVAKVRIKAVSICNHLS